MQNFHRIYQLSPHGNKELNDPNNLSMPAQVGGASTTISGAQQLFQSGLQSLIRAGGHQRGKHFNKIMYNIEVLVFCLWWFRVVGTCRLSIPFGSSWPLLQGFIDFPSDEETLRQSLNECDKFYRKSVYCTDLEQSDGQRHCKWHRRVFRLYHP